MRVIAVNGPSKSGKTTVCEAIIAGLRARGYSVGSVKEIHFEGFEIDPNPSANTRRHKSAGSELVTARALTETDVLHQKKLPILEILRSYDHDFVILEGVTDCLAPRIITGHTDEDVAGRIDGRAVLISGVFANKNSGEYSNLPIINVLTEGEKLVDFVEKTAFSPFPDVDPKCCGHCGYDCKTMCDRVCQGKSERSDCVLTSQKIELTVDGKPVSLVPFVQNILRNSVMAVASELKGAPTSGEVVVKFRL